MSGPLSEGGASFTALLDMPADQAVEILHDCGDDSAGWRRNDWGLKVSIDYCRPRNQFLDFSPPLPSTLGFVDRSLKQSVFPAAGGGDSPERTSIPSNSSGNSFIVKSEPMDSESNPSSSSHPGDKSTSPMSVKRKDRERKVKESTKKSRSSSKDSSGDPAEKLPYVHVRARRGQATDSHSLAERARREKINARMKLLQGLVPGCSKISGTALVLDEIINHVQSLQRQVEFLSMRLAAINPSADFTLDSLLASNNGVQTTAESDNICNMLMPIMWQGVECVEERDGRQGQPWQVNQAHHHNHHLVWERGEEDDHLLSSLYRLDNVADSDWS